TLLERAWRIGGAGDAEVAARRDTLRRAVTALREGRGLEPHPPAPLELFASPYARPPAAQKKRVRRAADLAAAGGAGYAAATAADRWLLGYEPGPTLQKVRCPVLALFGEKDFKVPLAPNRDALLRALPRDGDHTVLLIPGADHLFRHVREVSRAQFVP